MTIAPVVKTLELSCSVEHAFTVFTQRMATWWPLATHSIAGVNAESVTVEGEVGGRIVERASDGSEHVWGTILIWEPPTRLAFTWHPGRDASSAQHVEVRFESGTSTTVTLTHKGWEKLGDEAQTHRDGYDSGWDGVLADYVGAI
ncbi:MAG: SRPBCC family protein [Myxococcota bacterium]